ncbi:hypothetical protein K435DRAFT_848651 [Dendrothele bispora CBS 962.96]|uniref:Uncharacterized protein n=1 Tax=Dendrothele bispora (strain CBS 962.96) TaxID=1314807 RepID=A0A4S8MUR2_DENBC|nr:hypothetical protein K435DRAFT_848651 [Dendrothele bispora CBS 962.96]
MDPLQIDPNLETCPAFDTEIYQIIKTALINDPNSPNITNEEEAIQHLRNTWTAENEARKTRWEQQQETEREEAEQRRQEAEEADRLRKEEEKKKTEEQKKEKEKTRIPIRPIPSSRGIQRLQDRLHPYAKKKLVARKFFPLWYCLPEASYEATEYERNLTEDTGFSLVKNLDTTYAVKAIDAAKPSPRAKPDKALSWAEILEAKTVFLTNMPLGDYPPDHIRMFSQFYVNMETHHLLRTLRGKSAFVRYHAKVRWDWYETNEAGNTYNLAIINEDILRDCLNEVESEAMETTMSR